MDVMRFAIDLALLIWAAWATWAYFRWKEIADDLHDALSASDEALRGARKRVGELKQDLELQLVCNKNHIEQFALLDERLTAQQNLNIALDAELKKYRAKEKPMPCKGKKTGKGKRGK